MAEGEETVCVVEFLHALFDGLEDLVDVVDPQTHEILFANDRFKEFFGEDVVGRKCYEVIYKGKEPCSNCTSKYIFGENLGKVCVSEYRYKNRWYKCIDKAISWPGNKYVKLEMAIDITKHKEMEKALSKSEKRYRTLVEAAPDVIYVISSDGKIVSLNPAFEKITGWKLEDWVGKPFVEMIHLDDASKAVESFRKTLAGKPEPVELRVRTRSGAYLVGEFITVPIIEDGRIVGELGIARDVTSRKEYEEKIQKISATLQALVEAIPDIVYLKDLERRNLIVNSAYERLTGLKREEIVGKRDEEVLPPDLAEQCRKSDEIVLRNGVAVRAEEYTVNEVGEKRYFDTIKVPVFDRDGKIAGLIGVSRDITERKIMEEKLREREEFFRSVVENSHDGIAIIDENYRIAYANHVLVGILGYPKNEVVGEDFRKFLAEESKALFTTRRLQKQAKQHRGQQFSSRYELKIKRKDGGERLVEVKTTTIWDAKGRVRTIAQVLDVTQQMKLEEERKLFEKRLSELNKYAQRLNRAKSLKEIYRLTLDAMEKTLGSEYASILIMEENALRLVAHRGYSRVSSLRLPLEGSEGVTVKAAKTGKPVYVPDVRKEPAYVVGGEGMLSELAVPMKIGKKVLGVLNVESRRLNAFTKDDRRLFEILASHAAVAINNLKRQGKLAALNIYGRRLGKAKSIEEVYRQTLEVTRKVLGFKYVDIFLVKGNSLQLACSTMPGRFKELVLPLDGERGITVKAARTGKSVHVPDVRRDGAYVSGGVIGTLSELAVPIKLGDKVLGVLNVESEKLDAFDEEDSRLLEILASHVAIAISNIEKRENLEKLSRKLESLIKSSIKILQVKGRHEALKEVAKAVQKYGWRKVTICSRDENLECKDIASAGLTREEAEALIKRGIPVHVWRELLGPDFEKYKVGEFYCLSPKDPTVPGKVSEYFTALRTETLLYAPIRTPEGKIVGILTMGNPVDDVMLRRELLMPLELFLHHTALTMENVELMESLEKARRELESYADQLEEKVEERTRELREIHDQLLKAQRLAVIGEVAGMVGHDLRNPLTSIAGAAYYLKRRLAQTGDEKVMEMLNLIEKNIAYSNKIINDLLDYSREVKLDITETDPETIANEALAAVEIPSNINVVRLVNKKPKLKADFEKLKRVLVNLIRNAVEAMPKGGTLTIKSVKKCDSVEFTVSDTGIGMTEEVLRKLWTPLFTTKARGMGFGLAICKRFVEAHGGTMTVESAPGKGTTFTVAVPLEPKIEEGGEKVWLKTLESSLLTT
ncbi:MAG: PAS domain S-box protein, partial [Candidatus Bathyarchaeia archaeon]